MSHFEEASVNRPGKLQAEESELRRPWTVEEVNCALLWLRSQIHSFALLLLALAASLLATSAAADVRVALLVGDAHYLNAPPLGNPVNDATDLSATLSNLGFKTKLLVDAPKRDMDRAVEQFARDARTADVAVFFFAGHGMQYQGRNYVVPVDAELKDEISVAYELTAVDDLKSALQNSNGVKVLVLDSCRDNPLAVRLVRSMRPASRDLAQTEGFAPFARTSGMIVAYATQSGQTARDGVGRNSPFSGALLKELQTPRLEVGTLFRRVQSDVFDATSGVQEPELAISLVPEYYLNLGDTDQTIWARIRGNPDAVALQNFLDKFPHSFFAPDAAVRLKMLAENPSSQGTAESAALAVDANAAEKEPDRAKKPAPAARPLVSVADGSNAASISQADLGREVRQRLYDLNFDPGPVEGPFGAAAQEAVREFERKNNLPVTGLASQELLGRLRAAPVLKPWGAVVFDKQRSKWGMAWGAANRQRAISSANATCGDKACPVEVSFFGATCAAFAHSSSGWSIDARADVAKATEAALEECRRQGDGCEIVASVCADGSHRLNASR